MCRLLLLGLSHSLWVNDYTRRSIFRYDGVIGSCKAISCMQCSDYQNLPLFRVDNVISSSTFSACLGNVGWRFRHSSVKNTKETILLQSLCRVWEISSAPKLIIVAGNKLRVADILVIKIYGPFPQGYAWLPFFKKLLGIFLPYELKPWSENWMCYQ